ncbi:MAG: hypothetical protein KDC09_02880 [Bacteroidales bacterium]|nr:hypothetical protein [Bacteroidales bacterium]
MKNIRKVIFWVLVLMATPLIMQAQNPPHPNGGNDPGSGNTPVGGGAPIDGGITILITLAMGYGLKKTYNFKK